MSSLLHLKAPGSFHWASIVKQERFFSLQKKLLTCRLWRVSFCWVVIARVSDSSYLLLGLMIYQAVEVIIMRGHLFKLGKIFIYLRGVSVFMIAWYENTIWLLVMCTWDSVSIFLYDSHKPYQMLLPGQHKSYSVSLICSLCFKCLLFYTICLLE